MKILLAASLFLILADVGVAQTCTTPLGQWFIANCNYLCFPLCKDASVPQLTGAVNGCFFQEWGFGGMGLFGDVEVGLYLCDNPKERCRKVSGSRLGGNGVCSDTNGCLEIRGPTDACCPASLSAGGHECILYDAGNCGPSAPVSYGEYAPSICAKPELCRNITVSNNARCPSTQPSRASTGTFPNGCSVKSVCSADQSPTISPVAVATAETPSGKPITNFPTLVANEEPSPSLIGVDLPNEPVPTKNRTATKPEGEAAGEDPDDANEPGSTGDAQNASDSNDNTSDDEGFELGWEAIAVIVACVDILIGACCYQLKKCMEGKNMNVGKLGDLLQVQVDNTSNSKVPNELATRRERDEAACLGDASVAETILASHSDNSIERGNHWFLRDFVLAGVEENDTEVPTSDATDTFEHGDDDEAASNPENAAGPVEMIYITPSDFTAASPMTIASGAGMVGAIACHFTRSNPGATRGIRDVAQCAVDTEGASVPSWAQLYGLPSSGESDPGKTLVLPANDSMVGSFKYDGLERMTWRALNDGRSLVCVLTPTLRWGWPVIRGVFAIWADENTLDEGPYEFDISAKKMGRNRYEVQDKLDVLAGRADAESPGVALLAVFLCALDGSSSVESRPVSDFSYLGGRHAHGLISIT